VYVPVVIPVNNTIPLALLTLYIPEFTHPEALVYPESNKESKLYPVANELSVARVIHFLL